MVQDLIWKRKLRMIPLLHRVWKVLERKIKLESPFYFSPIASGAMEGWPLQKYKGLLSVEKEFWVNIVHHIWESILHVSSMVGCDHRKMLGFHHPSQCQKVGSVWMGTMPFRSHCSFLLTTIRWGNQWIGIIARKKTEIMTRDCPPPSASWFNASSNARVSRNKFRIPLILLHPIVLV